MDATGTRESDRDDFQPWGSWQPTESAWPQQLVLPLLLALAWLLFELTANATLCVFVACLKFGWQDFRTAIWLRRTDPVRPRGKSGFWFYLSSGIWKTAIVPILAVFIIGILWGLFASRAFGANEAILRQIHAAMKVGVGASAILVIVVGIAALTTWRNDLRMWVHHDLHHSRRENVWPPEWPYPLWKHDNRGRAILATALIVLTITLPAVLFPFAVMLAPGAEITVVLGIVFGVPIGAAFSYALLRERIFAITPEQCWPESHVTTPEELAQEAVLEAISARDSASVN